MGSLPNMHRSQYYGTNFWEKKKSFSEKLTSKESGVKALDLFTNLGFSHMFMS